jgi:hypothetical protein
MRPSIKERLGGKPPPTEDLRNRLAKEDLRERLGTRQYGNVPGKPWGLEIEREFVERPLSEAGEDNASVGPGNSCELNIDNDDRWQSEEQRQVRERRFKQLSDDNDDRWKSEEQRQVRERRFSHVPELELEDPQLMPLSSPAYDHDEHRRWEDADGGDDRHAAADWSPPGPPPRGFDNFRGPETEERFRDDIIRDRFQVSGDHFEDRGDDRFQEERFEDHRRGPDHFEEPHHGDHFEEQHPGGHPPHQDNFRGREDHFQESNYQSHQEDHPRPVFDQAFRDHDPYNQPQRRSPSPGGMPSRHDELTTYYDQRPLRRSPSPGRPIHDEPYYDHQPLRRSPSPAGRLMPPGRRSPPPRRLSRSPFRRLSPPSFRRSRTPPRRLATPPPQRRRTPSPALLRRLMSPEGARFAPPANLQHYDDNNFRRDQEEETYGGAPVYDDHEPQQQRLFAHDHDEALSFETSLPMPSTSSAARPRSMKTDHRSEQVKKQPNLTIMEKNRRNGKSILPVNTKLTYAEKRRPRPRGKGKQRAQRVKDLRPAAAVPPSHPRPQQLPMPSTSSAAPMQMPPIILPKPKTRAKNPRPAMKKMLRQAAAAAAAATVEAAALLLGGHDPFSSSQQVAEQPQDDQQQQHQPQQQQQQQQEPDNVQVLEMTDCSKEESSTATKPATDDQQQQQQQEQEPGNIEAVVNVQPNKRRRGPKVRCRRKPKHGSAFRDFLVNRKSTSVERMRQGSEAQKKSAREDGGRLRPSRLNHPVNDEHNQMGERLPMRLSRSRSHERKTRPLSLSPKLRRAAPRLSTSPPRPRRLTRSPIWRSRTPQRRLAPDPLRLSRSPPRRLSSRGRINVSRRSWSPLGRRSPPPRRLPRSPFGRPSPPPSFRRSRTPPRRLATPPRRLATPPRRLATPPRRLATPPRRLATPPPQRRRTPSPALPRSQGRMMGRSGSPPLRLSPPPLNLPNRLQRMAMNRSMDDDQASRSYQPRPVDDHQQLPGGRPPQQQQKGSGLAISGKCPCCGSKHHKLQNCQNFIEMNNFKRWDAVRRFDNVCSRCLSTGHSMHMCMSEQTCLVEGCTSTHHTLLHKTKTVVTKELVDLVSDGEEYSSVAKVTAIVEDQQQHQQHGGCMLCGNRGHKVKQCPNLICYKCKGQGHFSKECRAKRLNCAYCHMDGHELPTCPIIKCRKCGGAGHVANGCTTDTTDFTCTNCWMKGHAYEQCPVRELVCYNCDIKGHLIQKCPFIECKKCGGSGHRDRDCVHMANEFRRQQPGQQQQQQQYPAAAAGTSSGGLSIDYHHLEAKGSTDIQPPPRPMASMLGFFCERLLTQGRSLVLGDEMLHTWRLAGHNDDTLYDLIRRQRPPTRTQLRLILVKELANAAAGSIPLSVQISELLDETVDYFMPTDRVNLIEGKLTKTLTNLVPPPRQHSSLGLASSSAVSMRLEPIHAKNVEQNVNTSQSVDKLRRLATMVDLQVGAPGSEERQSFEGRMDNLEPLRVYIVEKMRLVANQFSISESYVQTSASAIGKVLAGSGFSLYIMRRHLSSYGSASLAELVTTKIRFYEPHFPAGVNSKYIVTFILDYLEDNRF